METGNIALT